MKYDVIVIGGGLSGLSAAVELSSRGQKILLLEQKPHLGGRTYSYLDRTTGDVVDNGQHLMMGCYHETRRYLNIIGSTHLASLQKNLHIEFIHPRNGRSVLACPPLPAPLHVLVGLLRLDTIPFADRLKLLRVGLPLVFGTDEKKLAVLTVDEWLKQLKQNGMNRKYLWDIIAIGTLNDHPDTVSALLFYRVLRAAFLGKKENSSLLIPRVGLSELLVDPAVEFIQRHGGHVRTNAGVERFEIDRGRIKGVWVGRKKLEAHAYISAVPWYAFSSLLTPQLHYSPPLSRLTTSGLRRASITPVEAFSRFESSPIITINVWLDREVMKQEFVAVLDRTVQWVFNKSRIIGLLDQWSNRLKRQYLSCVISGAKEYLSWSKEKMMAMVMEELRSLFPDARSANVLHSVVIKEKRATFSPRPEVEPYRPSSTTDYSNLFLAGDWTDTGYPATIEGAVLSGRRAAEATLHSLEPSL